MNGLADVTRSGVSYRIDILLGDINEQSWQTVTKSDAS